MQFLIWLGAGLYRFDPRTETWKHDKAWKLGDETQKAAFYFSKNHALNELGKIVVMDGESAIEYVFRQLGIPVANDIGDLTKQQVDVLTDLARKCGLNFEVCSYPIRPFLKKPTLLYALASHFAPGF